MKIKLTKIEIAEVQLNEAIYLFFSKAHPIIIETLTGATLGVLLGLAEQRRVHAPLHDSDRIKPEYKKIWLQYIRKAQNFSKHADKDPEDILEWETTSVHFSLFEVCHLYRHLASDLHLKHRQSSPAILFEIWFGHKYPNLLLDKEEYLSFLRSAGLPDNFSTEDYELLKLAVKPYRIPAPYENTDNNAFQQTLTRR
jgi:hypothetical protein